MQTARLPVLALLVVCLLSSAPVLAEVDPADELSGEVSAEINSTAGYAPAAPSPAALPNAPAPHEVRVKVIDKKFIAVMAALAGAESLRFTTHKLVLDHEFAAGAPWVTSVPENRHLIAKYGAIYAAELLVAYELKKPHSWLPGDRYMRKLWWAYPAAMLPIHFKNGMRSIRTQAPAGCPPELCQGQ